MRRINVYEDANSLATQAAIDFVKMSQEAIEIRGRFSVALSGGSTPKMLFNKLAEDAYARVVQWDRIDVFWGDERCVPPDHEDSNYNTARQELLERVPLPEENIYRMRGELDPRRAANAYEDLLRGYFLGRTDGVEKNTDLTFDLIYLGMGDDGHTASLFPKTTALQEKNRWVVANYVDMLGVWRLTLTAPAINLARMVVFLVAGSGKRARLKEVLEGPQDPQSLPSQLINPQAGELVWMVDQAVAGSLIV
jgi:6-phosphogluconolactonase